MTSKHIPQEVLSQQLGDKLGGRRVRSAVFTTYTFDPGFFEAHILPVLFDKPFHQVEKVRLIQPEIVSTSLCSAPCGVWLVGSRDTIPTDAGDFRHRFSPYFDYL